jgi:Uma2 family endonuclease
MHMSVSTLLTEEEFLNLPETPCKQELLDGELIELPPAKRSHSQIVKRFVRLLETVLDETRVWSETGYRLGPRRWLTPDVSVSWPDQPVENDYFQSSPMVAIEIASRGNTAENLDRKVSAYLETGAEEIWVVYPKTRSMVVFRKDSTQRVPADAEYRCALIGVTVTPEHRAPAIR